MSYMNCLISKPYYQSVYINIIYLERSIIDSSHGLSHYFPPEDLLLEMLGIEAFL